MTLIWGAAAALSISCKPQADTADRRTSATEIADAADILREFSEFIRSTTQFTVTVRHTVRMETVTRGGEFVPATYTLHFSAPGRIALLQDSGYSGVSIVRNREQLHVWRTPFNAEDTILVDLAPDSQMLIDDELIGKRNAYLVDGVLLLRSLVTDPLVFFERRTSNIRYVGLEHINGELEHRLEMLHSDLRLDVWFSAGDRRILKRVIASAADNSDTMGVRSSIEYSGWSFDPIVEDVFDTPSPRCPAVALERDRGAEK